MVPFFFLQAFNKARRMETRERLNDHMVTYKDWQRILECIKVPLSLLNVLAYRYDYWLTDTCLPVLVC